MKKLKNSEIYTIRLQGGRIERLIELIQKSDLTDEWKKVYINDIEHQVDEEIVPINRSIW